VKLIINLIDKHPVRLFLVHVRWILVTVIVWCFY
jgi:hypothetical protein